MPAANAPFVTSVLHATDFSEASHAAFAHALAIALHRKAELTLLHAGRSANDDWTRFPAVRETLETWGLLEAGSQRADVSKKLGLSVKKIDARGTPLEAAMQRIEKGSVDLLVLATEQRSGLPAWFRPSQASKLTRDGQILTLVVPQGGRKLVSPEDGSIHLERILVPIDRTPDPSWALEYASRVCELAPDAEVTTTVLHVGDAMPEFALPHEPRCKFEPLLRPGDPVEQVVATAKEQECDLVVMASEGRGGLLDVLRGSVSERVLQRVPCPILVVPRQEGVIV